MVKYITFDGEDTFKTPENGGKMFVVTETGVIVKHPCGSSKLSFNTICAMSRLLAFVVK